MMMVVYTVFYWRQPKRGLSYSSPIHQANHCHQDSEAETEGIQMKTRRIFSLFTILALAAALLPWARRPRRMFL